LGTAYSIIMTQEYSKILFHYYVEHYYKVFIMERIVILQ
jgi:hypothetical protein